MSAPHDRYMDRLHIRDFRSFAGEYDLDVGGDVVLVYGPNGAGKTTLIQAIEYALTGRVDDLARFHTDYPRCLAPASSPTAQPVSRMIWRAGSEVQDQSSYAHGSQLPSADARYFSERAYLSQTRLHRLLDMYGSSEDPDKPIVRFVEELLRLEELGALVDGLHTAGDVRRTKKKVVGYAGLADQSSEYRDSIKELARQLDEEKVRFESYIQALPENARLALSTAVPNLDFTPMSSEDLLRATSALVDSLKAVPLCIPDMEFRATEITELLAQLQSLPGLLEALAKVRTSLDSASSRRSSLLPMLTPDLSAAETLLRELHLLESEPDDGIGSRFEQAERVLRHSLERIEAEGKRRILLMGEIEHAKQAIAEFQQAADAPVDGDNAGDISLRIDILTHALAAQGDVCPVCSRDFAETGSGPLATHVSAELSLLTARRDDLQTALERKKAAVERLTTLRSSLSSQELQLAAIPVHGESKLEKMRRALARLESLRASVADWSENEGLLNGLAKQVAQMEQEISPMSTAKDRALQLLEREDAPPVADEDVVSLLESESKRLAASLEKARQQTEEMHRFRALATRATESLERIHSTIEELERIRQRKAEVDESLDRAKSIHDDARRLCSTAQDVRADLLNRAFNDQLNALWESLFRRLVPGEPFAPAFRVPDVIRGKLNIGMLTRSTVGDFCSPGAVLSAGNLNTAALTLFLSLNLVRSPRLPILLLDDPVQSMDDIHIVNLAALLRTIRRDHGRQLLISVHERALFDYLSLELAPAMQGESLSLIEIGTPGTTKERISTSRREWVPDLVEATA